MNRTAKATTTSTQGIEKMLDFTETDFSRLSVASGEWAKALDRPNFGWRKQILDGRFETLDEAEIPAVCYLENYKYAHWIGDNYTAIIFIRSYLNSLKEPFLVLWDTADSGAGPGYLLLCDKWPHKTGWVPM